MKKLIATILAAALCLALAACGKSPATAESAAPTSTPVMEAVIPVGTAEPEPEPKNERLRAAIPVIDSVDAAYALVSSLSAPEEEVRSYDVPESELPALLELIRAVDLDGCEYSEPDSAAVSAEGFWSAYDYSVVISLADSSTAEDGWYMYMLLVGADGARDVLVARTDAEGDPVAYQLFTGPEQPAFDALGDFVLKGAGVE